MMYVVHPDIDGISQSDPISNYLHFHLYHSKLQQMLNQGSTM